MDFFLFSFVIYIIWDLISAAVCSLSFNLFRRDSDSLPTPSFYDHLLIFPHFESKEHPPTTLNTVALRFIFVFCAGFGLSCRFSVVLAAQNVRMSLTGATRTAESQIHPFTFIFLSRTACKPLFIYCLFS